jgi:hypothetical protein
MKFSFVYILLWLQVISEAMPVTFSISELLTPMTEEDFSTKIINKAVFKVRNAVVNEINKFFDTHILLHFYFSQIYLNSILQEFEQD